MDIVKNILINHWKELIIILSFIFTFILQLVKKKPVKVVDLISKILYEIIPMYINLTEADTTIKGPRKKEKCLAYIEDWFVTNKIDFTPYYRNIAGKAIEAILSTPQKHEKDK